MRCLGGAPLSGRGLHASHPSHSAKNSIDVLLALVLMQNPATHAEAERVILEFHNAADAIPACLHVLQQSQDVGAIFQAAVALRKACINNGWAKLQLSSRLELRDWVMQFILHHGKGGSHGPMAPVLQTMIETHAVILKLLWLELPQEQSCAFIQVSLLHSRTDHLCTEVSLQAVMFV